MALEVLNLAVEFTLINCGECGGSYAINERYRKQKATEGGTWNCPYCKCGWGYSNDNENARLRKQLADETERKNRILAEANLLRASRDRTQRRLRAQRGATTRISNRVKSGVCPCCTRSFTNLRQHMANKHPNFAPVIEP